VPAKLSVPRCWWPSVNSVNVPESDVRPSESAHIHINSSTVESRKYEELCADYDTFFAILKL